MGLKVSRKKNNTKRGLSQTSGNETSLQWLKISQIEEEYTDLNETSI